MSTEKHQVEMNLFAEVSKAAEELYNIRDTYFPVDSNEKLVKLRSESDMALRVLDSIPLEQRKSVSDRAMFEYLKGKILDVFPEYKKEAEDHLSKAVKLNPSLGDAWLSLGNCIWKKGDLAATKNCFMLSLKKGPNKRILCQLSMLERKMSQGAENQTELVEESIKHAKEAVSLDVKDGSSWYNLGNACLTYFFVTGAWDHSKLLQSLKAYQNAERDEKMMSNPDLYFNCAIVNKYMENYVRALSGFEAAASKDPGLNAMEEVEKLVHVLDKFETLLKSQTKTKRLASLTSSLTTVNGWPNHMNPSYKGVTVDRLVEGMNKAVSVVGKVLFFVRHKDVAPLYYIISDSNQLCYILSVYGMRDDAIKEGDQVLLLEPCFRLVDFSWKEKNYSFKSVRIDFLEQILVNGKAVPPSHAVKASIIAQHKA